MFSWQSNINLAEHLAQIDTTEMMDDPEVYYRASVGRSYYACHKTVHDWLDNYTQYAPPQDNSSIHSHVINNIRTYMSSPQAGLIQYKLSNLRGHRVEADYNLIPTSSWTKSRAESSVKEAREIITALASARPSI